MNSNSSGVVTCIVDNNPAAEAAHERDGLRGVTQNLNVSSILSMLSNGAKRGEETGMRVFNVCVHGQHAPQENKGTWPASMLPC